MPRETPRHTRAGSARPRAHPLLRATSRGAGTVVRLMQKVGGRGRETPRHARCAEKAVFPCMYVGVLARSSFRRGAAADHFDQQNFVQESAMYSSGRSCSEAKPLDRRCIHWRNRICRPDSRRRVKTSREWLVLFVLELLCLLCRCRCATSSKIDEILTESFGQTV